jgi:RNA polymerase sigma-B factor
MPRQSMLPSPAEPLRRTSTFDEAEVDRLLEELSRCTVRAHRERLRQEVVLAALGLADALAQRYAGRGLDPDDVRQIARLGLIKAVDAFDPRRGYPFGAFAVPSIRGEVKRFFRDSSWAVRPPRRLQEVGALLLECEARLAQELQREPNDEELAAGMGVTSQDVRAARASRAAYTSVSLDAPLPGTDFVPAPVDAGVEQFEILHERDALAWAISCLTDRERLIVRLRFDEEFTQEQIGRVLGVSQMQISRLLVRIVGRLREQMRSMELSTDAGEDQGRVGGRPRSRDEADVPLTVEAMEQRHHPAPHVGHAAEVDAERFVAPHGHNRVAQVLD